MTIAPSAVPVLKINVEAAAPQEFAAVPTLRFSLRVESDGQQAIRSLALDTQIRVAAPRRSYDAATRERLAGLFGSPDQWSRSLRSLLWTHTTVFAPAFTGSTSIEMPVGCTYDFEAGIVGYFRALEEGDIPLEFLFSGMIFYTDGDGFLQTARIPWDTEAEFRLPVHVWDRLIDLHYPGSAWLRVRRETAQRLSAYQTRHVLTSVDDAVDALLRQDGGPWTR